MARDKTESHIRIKAVAKQEFLEKGFENASMREIGKKAGITPAGLYRHYESKEAMFSDLVDPFIETLMELSHDHETTAYDEFNRTLSSQAMVKNNVVKMMKGLLEHHRDELKLIVCCSHGTKYESFINDLVQMETKGTMEAFNYIRNHGNSIREISEDELHVLLSAYFAAILEPVVHDWPLDKAMRCLDLVEDFFLPSWKHIMGF